MICLATSNQCSRPPECTYTSGSQPSALGDCKCGSVICSNTVGLVCESSTSTCKCQAEKYMDSNSSVCVKCGVGKFSSGVGKLTESTCKTCISGKYSNEEGSALLLACTSMWIMIHLTKVCCATKERKTSKPLTRNI